MGLGTTAKLKYYSAIDLRMVQSFVNLCLDPFQITWSPFYCSVGSREFRNFI